MQEMKKVVKSKYEEIFATKQLDARLQEQAVEFLCSEKKPDSVPMELVKLDFTGEDLVILAEVLSVADRTFLANFLHFLLGTKKNETLFLFFSKVFVNRIGKTNYQSKNASSFDIRERTFDRFIEATMWTEIDFPEFAGLLFASMRAGDNTGISNWRRPAEEFIFSLAINREAEFFRLVFQNFDDFGMTAFEFLLSRNSRVALRLLAEHYIKEDFPQKRQVRNLLKQRFAELIEVIKELQQGYKISPAQVVELLLIFPQHPYAKAHLIEIYKKEKSPELKSRIAENIDIPFEPEITSLLQLKKLSQRFESADTATFLGRKLDKFPKLLLKNKEEATSQLVGYMLERYQQLCSPYASGELSFFRGFFAPENMDAFCEEVATLVGSDDHWAITLLAQNCSLDSMPKISAILTSQKVNASLFIAQFIREKGSAVFALFDTLDKNNRADRQVLESVLKNIMQSGRFEPLEVEILRDKMVPDFDLNHSGELVADGAKMHITDQFEVECSETALSKKASTEKKRLEREVKRQLKRFKVAFECGRTWDRALFESLILGNNLMRFIASKLLWARYRKDALLGLVRITEKGTEEILSLDKTAQDFVFGIFHPVENTDRKWIEIFGNPAAGINQFGRETFDLAKYNPYASLVTRFNGMIVQANQFFDRLGEFGWNFGIASFNGSINSMFKLSRELNLLCQIDFSPIQKHSFDASLSLNELRFYRLNTVLATGNNFIPDKTTALELGTLPKRWFSDVIWELTVAGRK